VSDIVAFSGCGGDGGRLLRLLPLVTSHDPASSYDETTRSF